MVRRIVMKSKCWNSPHKFEEYNYGSPAWMRSDDNGVVRYVFSRSPAARRDKRERSQ